MLNRLPKPSRNSTYPIGSTDGRSCFPGTWPSSRANSKNELPDWNVMVGPREAVDLPAYMKTVLSEEPTVQ